MLAFITITMDKEDLELISNYASSEEAMGSLLREQRSHSENFIPEPNKSFLKIAYEYVSEKSNCEGVDHRFLCWLKIRHNYSIDINLPHFSVIKQMELDAFRKSYLFTNERQKLFETLCEFISTRKELTMVDSISVLIGGSFSDMEIAIPNDIDIAMLIPEGYNKDLCFNEFSLRANRMIPRGIDLSCIPENLNQDSFKVFSRLVILSNNAKFKDSALNFDFLNSNKFKPRDIVQISI